MSERESFLKAIIENKADDTPRLVFADWLDEHDDPTFAKFIRVMCSPAYRDKSFDASDCDYRKGEQKWLGNAVIKCCHEGSASWFANRHMRMRRGFLSEIGCSSADWIKWGDQIVQEWPIEKVWLSDAPPCEHFPLYEGLIQKKRVHWISGIDGRRFSQDQVITRQMELGRWDGPDANRTNYPISLLSLTWPGIEFRIVDGATGAQGPQGPVGATGAVGPPGWDVSHGPRGRRFQSISDR